MIRNKITRQSVAYIVREKTFLKHNIRKDNF